MRRRYVIALAAVTCALCLHLIPPTPTVISVGVGYTFEQVRKASTYPVADFSNIPPNDRIGFGATWVTEPSVIIRFEDPRFGFSLPPTTFAAIGYMHNKVDTITTSPMLKKLPFERTMNEVAQLQGIFQEQGWQLENDATWFDLSPQGRADLRARIRLGNHGCCKWVSLRAPGKYSMIFRLRCVDDCDSKLGLDRYLIDISIGED